MDSTRTEDQAAPLKGLRDLWAEFENSGSVEAYLRFSRASQRDFEEAVPTEDF